MYIKQLTISNFKSYGGTVVIPELTRGVNIIVGTNGSGKSNIIAAISFLLTRNFDRMSIRERQELINNGSDFASVEMEIDLENEENLILKRLITATKEEYFINGESKSQLEYRSKLEEKNLSQTNSYFIVPQSKIIEVSNQRNYERFELLKDICGANRYEAKKNQGLKEIEKSNKSLDEIKTTLDSLHNQKDKLKAEKAIFDGYARKNNELRSLQYNLYKKELDKSNKDAVKIGIEITEQSKALQVEEDKLKEMEMEKDKISEENNQYLDDIRTYNEKIKEHENLLNKEKYNINKLTLELGKLEPDLDNEKLNKIVLSKQLDDINIKKDELMKQIQFKQTEYNRIKSDYDKFEKERKENDKRYQELLEKKRRCSVYRNVNERNRELDRNIEELNDIIKKYRNEIDGKKKDLEDVDKKKKVIENELNRINQMDFNKEKNENEKKRKALEDIKARLNEDESRINAKISDLNEIINRETVYFNTTNNNFLSQSKNAIDAIKYLNKYCKDNKIKGYYGALIDLFTLKNEYTATAVEKTAGKKLFNCVVDTMETAFNLSTVLKDNRKGRITFIPLEDVNKKDSIKVVRGDKCALLKDLLNYDNKYENAFQYVFSNTIFCGDYNDGLVYSKKYNTNVVIINGNEIKIKGEITGGYINPNKLILKNYIEMKKHKNNLEEAEKKRLDYIQESEKIKEEKLKCGNKINDLITSQSNTVNEEYRIMNKKNDYLRSIENNENQRNGIIEEIQSKESSINQHQLKIQEYENEKRQPFQNDLDADENNELNRCQEFTNNTFANYCKVKESESTMKAELDAIITSLKVMEDEEKEIIVKLNTFTNNDQNSVVGKSLEYDSIKKSISLHEERINRINENLNNIKVRLDEIIELQSETQLKEDEISKEYDELHEIYTQEKINLNRLISKSEQIKNSNYNHMKAIRDLGSLPKEQLEENQNKSKHELQQGIEELTAEIKNEYSAVNQKSIQQYQQIKKTFVEFTDKYNILNNEKDEIYQFVSSIDDKEMDIIIETFNNLNKSFGNIFRLINPNGKAELHLQHTDDGKIEGIAINVRFDRNQSSHLLSQLSGGQKTVVAIAFLFALQEISKSPFYLFDEIDDALDHANREIVSRLIEIKKPNIQFIATTFKREMAEVGDRFIRVESLAQKSEAKDIHKSDALGFLTLIENNEDNDENIITPRR